jgi:hypothetical protein
MNPEIYYRHYELVIYHRPTHNVTHLKTVVGPKNIPDVMSRVHQNMLDYYGIGTNIIANYIQDIRFSDTHNASQARQPFVNWIPYGQGILMPELTANQL